MSRNNKNATRKAQAKAFSETRKNGGRSAAKTTPLHGKRWGYRTNPETIKRLAEATKTLASVKKGTAAEEILSKAGKAAA